MKVALLLIGGLGLLVAGALLYGRWRWAADTRALRSELAAAALATPPDRFRLEQTAGVPAPVQRYFRAVLREGQPRYRSARIQQRGEFLVRPAEAGWGPFTASEDLTARPPGFLWDATIRMGPGLSVRVRDGLVNGQGFMLGKAAGLITVVSMGATPEIAAGAMHRYLAEAVWCPTALLPSEALRWSPVDDSTARATVTLGPVSVSLDFFFGADSLVYRIYAADRRRDEHGVLVPRPWQGLWSTYEVHEGMRIPVVGMVEWLLPTGPQPYWRGRVTAATYRE
jgi:hypothetical protein